MAETVEKPPAMQETQVPSLGGEDPLEKEMATHSSTLAWKIPWTEKPWGCKESDMTEQLPFTCVVRSGVHASQRCPHCLGSECTWT